MIERLIVLGLGGNVGDDAAILARFASAAEALAAWGGVRRSPVYRTAPLGGPRDQSPFLNAALSIAVDPPDPEPAELIASVLEIERLLGRDRSGEVANGPRAIDVDVLLWGTRVGRWPGPPPLEVPHPRLRARRFALAPLIDLLGGDVLLPGTQEPLVALWQRAADQRVELTDLVF